VARSDDPKKEGAMRRFIPAALLAAGVLIVSPVAASGAPGFHDRFDDTFDLPDFCGSGVTVQVRDVVVGNGHESDTRLTIGFNEKVTFTHGDRSITSHAAGRILLELVEGDSFEGPHTEFDVETGVRAQLKVPGGGLVQSDAGNLQFLGTFDENGDFHFEILKDAGHHEQFQSDVFCNAALPLLGIPS
jgi:hypothetical protein